MKPALVIRDPLGRTRDLPLTEPEYSLGRSTENDLILEGSQISRLHCVLQREGEGYVIADRGSRNGVYVNGRQVQEAQLKDRDVIRVGSYVLIYAEESPAITQSGIESDQLTVIEDYDRLVARLTSIVHGATSPDEKDILQRMEMQGQSLRLLFELSQAVTSLYSLEQIGRKAIDILLQATQADRGAIFLLEGQTQELTPFLVCERNADEGSDTAVSISSTLARRILSERKAIITVHAAEDPRFAHAESVVKSGLRSVACAPLVGTGGNLGILYLENNRYIGAFTHENLELLCAVAAQVGLSAENASFFQALTRANEDLEKKVEERTSQLRESEWKLYRAEKMASLSRLVAGVAHQINNPLAAVKANLELALALIGRLGQASGDQAAVELTHQLSGLGQDSVAACTRILEVVRSLRTFARLDESEFKPANVNEGLKTAANLLEPAVRGRIRIALDLGDVPDIPCYPALLNEAFMNLLSNAAQAIAGEGTISIETQRQEDKILISIRDTGRGIAREHLDKIFDPGFTTRGVRVGIGLGLPIVYRVIQEHEGEVEVLSEPGHGARFIIKLPLNLQDPRSRKQSAPSLPSL